MSHWWFGIAAFALIGASVGFAMIWFVVTVFQMATH